MKISNTFSQTDPERVPDPRRTKGSTGDRHSVCGIVINYFGAQKTARCLRSLVGEPLSTLILVDNSATSGEHRTLFSLIEELRVGGLEFPIHTLFNDENLGFGRAINRAIVADQAATGGHDYYLLLNNDAEATPGLVAGLLRATAEDPTRALVAPRIRWGDGEVGYFWYQPYMGHVSRKRFPGSFPYLSGCCLLVDSSIVQDGRLFDEDFFMYAEDAELSARVWAMRRTIACVDDLLALHEGSGSSSHGGTFYECQVARGHVLMADKLARSPSQRLLMRLGRLLYLGARAAVRAVRYRSAVPLRAFGSAWAGSAAALRRAEGPALDGAHAGPCEQVQPVRGAHP